MELIGIHPKLHILSAPISRIKNILETEELHENGVLAIKNGYAENPIIAIKNVTYFTPSNNRLIFKEINLSIQKVKNTIKRG